MAQMKKLAQDTAIYGMSSIVGKFLNWCLVPMYVRILPNAAEYGVVTNLYAWSAFMMILLTYGMETGFFRFANKSDEEAHNVYSTTLWGIGSTTTLFLLLTYLLLDPLSGALGYADYPQYIGIMLSIVAMDAFSAIPFAYLRYRNRPVRFALLKLLFIGLNIALNLFFLLLCPYLYNQSPESVSWFYTPDQGVWYILLSNFIATLIGLLALLPEILQSKFKIDFPLFKRMLAYSFPLLVLGIAGIINQTADKMLLPFLIPNENEAMHQLGIYGANFKVAVVMVMFTQAFRFAYEPFIFAQKQQDNRSQYAEAMKFFVIFSLLIFLSIMAYIDVLKFIISPAYYEGLKVIPIVMMAELFFGVYFNLSLWYKLSDQTRYGAYLSGIGCVLTVAFNVLFVPTYGYIACAWASFASYLIITIISYFLGQKHYPIVYPIKKLTLYFVGALLLYAGMECAPIENSWIRIAYRSLLLFIFVGTILKLDLPISQLRTMIRRRR